MVKCPKCGASVYVRGRRWLCYSCGTEGCGLAGLEVIGNDKSFSSNETLQPKRISVQREELLR